MNPKLAVMDKFTILMDRLRSTPLATVRSYLAAREPGYPKALQALLSMYHRPTDIRARIVEQFRNKNPASRDDDHQGLLSLVNSLREVHGVLDLLVTDEWFYNETLLKAVYPLTPPEVQRLMRVSGQMDYISMFKMMETHLNSQSRARTLLGHSALTPVPPPARKPESKPSKTAPKKAIALVVAPAVSAGERIKTCLLCPSAEHALKNCTTYANGRARSNRAKELKLCFRCLSNQHFSRLCDYTGKCKRCNRGHLDELCLLVGQNSRPGPSINPIPAQRELVNRVEPAVEQAPTVERSVNTVVPVAAAYQTRRIERTYLPVVPGQVAGGRRVGTVNVLLDGGSTNSFISRRKANEFGLLQKKVDNFFVGGFGQTQTEITHETVITLYNVAGSEVGRFTLYVTPFAMGVPMIGPSAGVKELLTSKGINVVVDPYLPQNEVDLLIGTSDLHLIETGEKVRLSNKLAAIGTSLGWAISGAEDNERPTDQQ